MTAQLQPCCLLKFASVESTRCQMYRRKNKSKFSPGLKHHFVILPSCSRSTSEQTASHSRAGSSCWCPLAQSSWCRWAADSGCRWSSYRANCCPCAPSSWSLVASEGETRHWDCYNQIRDCSFHMYLLNILDILSSSYSSQCSAVTGIIHIQLQLMTVCWFLLTNSRWRLIKGR